MKNVLKHQQMSRQKFNSMWKEPAFAVCLNSELIDTIHSHRTAPLPSLKTFATGVKAQ